MRLVDRRRSGCGASLHQIAGDLGLAINRDRFAGQRLEVDAVAHAFYTDLRAVMHEPFALHASAHPDFVEQVDGALFDDSRANPLQHVSGRLAFKNDVVDPMPLEQLAEQEAGWAGTDDCDLRAHKTALRSLRTRHFPPAGGSASLMVMI